MGKGWEKQVKVIEQGKAINEKWDEKFLQESLVEKIYINQKDCYGKSKKQKVH